MMHHRTILLLLAFLCTVGLSAQNKDHSQDKGKAFLGINYELISKEKARLLGFDNPHGDYITKVIKNTAADKAGLKIFDYIYGVDDFRVGKDHQLGQALKGLQPGDKITVHFYRQGRSFSLPVTLGTRTDVKQESKSHAFLGISQHNEHDERTKGVMVNVVDHSAAKEMGLESGDVILSINTYPMITWSDIATVIESMEPGQAVNLTYKRDGQKMRASGKVKSMAETKQYTAVKPKKKVKPYLGIQYDELSGYKAEKLGVRNPYGTYITQVYPGTAADRAGLLAFDYIVGIDNYIFGEDQDLGVIMGKYSAGDEAILRVIRGGGKVDLEVVFGNLSDKKTLVIDKCEKAFFGIIQINSKEKTEGVVVDIVPNSTAEDMGLKKGAMIIRINNHNTYDWSDITAAISQLKKGEQISVEFMQEGKKEKNALPIKSYCETKKIEGNSQAESLGKEAESWAVTAPGMMEEGEPVDINNVDLMISDISDMEASMMDYETGVSNLRVDYLSINPHPESGKFLMEFSLEGTGDLSVRLHNGAAREIYSYESADFNGPFSDTVNISQNGTGNYYIEIKHGNRHLCKKITLAAM